MSKLPLVSIVGRPNVGKSSLFNRILKRRAAVVSDREGVTRDRHYQDTYWNEKHFTLIDTGGYLLDTEVDEMAESVRGQISAALLESDLVIFMVDGRVGVSELDQQFAELMIREEKQVILCANKNEKEEDRFNLWEFMNLGFGDAIPISAATGYGVGKLLDMVTDAIPSVSKVREVDEIRRVAILGRPNAGKSTLLNKLMGDDRLITSDVPGTTRDSIDCQLKIHGRNYVITDTAGLRKKAKVSDSVEYYSNMRSLESVRRADVCVVLCDANHGLETQDYRIIQQIRQADKGLVIVFNKWDIFEDKDHRSYDEIRKALIKKDPLLAYVPLLSISAMEGQRVGRLINTIDMVYQNCHRVLGRDRLEELFQKAVLDNPHPSRHTKKIRLDRACQIMITPPVIMVETNQPALIDTSWKRYFTKILYDNFNLDGAHVKLNFDRILKLRKDEELLEHGGIH